MFGLFAIDVIQITRNFYSKPLLTFGLRRSFEFYIFLAMVKLIVSIVFSF